MKVTTDACLFGAWVASRQSAVDRRGRVLDIGTGTGLLALMLAQKMSGAFIDAIEMDKEAFEQASFNTAGTPWENRVSIIQGDANLFAFTEKYDIIISNPPFYEKELKGNDSKKNIAHHDEGLLLPELLTLIKNNLRPGGTFYLLLPFKRNDEIRELFSEQEFDFIELVLVRQSVKHDYFRIMLEGRSDPGRWGETNLNEIAVKDENDVYTPEFTELLKDYYLKL